MNFISFISKYLFMSSSDNFGDKVGLGGKTKVDAQNVFGGVKPVTSLDNKSTAVFGNLSNSQYSILTSLCLFSFCCGEL